MRWLVARVDVPTSGDGINMVVSCISSFPTALPSTVFWTNLDNIFIWVCLKMALNPKNIHFVMREMMVFPSEF